MEVSENNNIKKEHISSARGCCFVNTSNPHNPNVNQQNCCKLSTFNWLADYSDSISSRIYIAEIRFKNGRKGFYSFGEELKLKEGEIVAVEASPGHDIGIVSILGDAVNLQMKRKGVDPETTEFKKIYRHARAADIEKWFEAMKLENSTMYKTRVFAIDLGLQMKINDVEYQGDKTKAIFYYTADERVDFRQLIRKLADSFHIRIEMKQIGVRQEAAKLGGIGPCGRELCCSSWMSSFSSVSTNSARLQQLSLNPQKLAGQCGKLKCCLNYETDSYVDALKEFPDSKTVLKTKKGPAAYQKTDVFKRLMWYSYTEEAGSLLAIPVDKVKKIMKINEKGKLIDDLESFAEKEDIRSNSETPDGFDIVSYQ
jgi:cell fate regulator YaaT (PSP1 superfamily)